MSGSEVRGFCNDCETFYDWVSHGEICPYCAGFNTDKYERQSILRNPVKNTTKYVSKPINASTILICVIIIASFAILFDAISLSRSSSQQTGIYRYVGNKNSNIYHKPSCELVQKISSYNRVWFRNEVDTIIQGYRACKACKP